jgi:hypothetical protein
LAGDLQGLERVLAADVAAVGGVVPDLADVVEQVGRAPLHNALVLQRAQHLELADLGTGVDAAGGGGVLGELLAECAQLHHGHVGVGEQQPLSCGAERSEARVVALQEAEVGWPIPHGRESRSGLARNGLCP